MCANLGAAMHYKASHLEANMDTLRNSKLLYATAYFITSSPEALRNMLSYATDTGTPMAFNMSATFLVESEKEVLNAIEHADYVFGNGAEVDAFAKT